MKPLRRLLARCKALFSRPRDERRMRAEFEEHIALATEDFVKSGLSPEEARREAMRKFGSAGAMREEWRDQRGLPWIESLASDVVFGWRQLRKHRAVTAAAILSLALAIGATTGAFRLVDAVLLRTLPVADPGNLFVLANTFTDREGRPDYNDYFDYPTFRQYREIIADRADSLLAGGIARRDAFIEAGDEPERLYRQYVSGNLFPVFGLQPAIGRLLGPSDDVSPGAHPVAVLSHDYWTRRFGGDPNVLGKTFRMDGHPFEIVGIGPKGFIGTEPGKVTDVFIPAMMNAEAIDSPGWSWFRFWVRPRPGFSPEQVRQPLQAAFTEERKERSKGFHSDTPQQIIDALLNEKIFLISAASGASSLQKEYRRPLLILGALVVLVLLVACINVANLLTAQSAARAREMALRMSIGAGRRRLVQLVLVESAMLAAAASALGAVFASWSAALVVSMLHVPGDPVRLVLETGWREMAFSAALALLVTLIFGLVPALRASSVHPIRALKGADDPSARRGLMNAMLASQVAFCVLVLFVSWLFVSTFQRLSNRPLGFSSENVLVMDVGAGEAQPPETWMQAADHLRQTPGVHSAAFTSWAILSGNRWSLGVRLAGRPVETRNPNFLGVSPDFFETMRIGWIDGRDFRHGDLPPRLDAEGRPLAGKGIVNETFARVYFHGENPVGRTVDVLQRKDLPAPMEIVGYVRDAAYYNMRDPMPPIVYVPMENRGHVTFLVRTEGNPEALASVLRHEVSRSLPGKGIQVVQTQPQENFIRWHLVRERLLSTLSLFFAIVALLLAAVGLNGVLSYSVTQQHREIGIRMALGARAGHVLWKVTVGLTAMVCLGLAIGVAGGLLSARFIETLLYEVNAADLGTVAIPVATLAGVALLAGLPPARRATRIDPAQTLRSD